MEENSLYMDHLPIPQHFAGCVANFCHPVHHCCAARLLEVDGFWGAVGIHPKSADEFTLAGFQQMENLIVHNKKVIAVGEAGLDRSHGAYTTDTCQEYVFLKQCALARRLNLPLVVHCRDAEDRCQKLLKSALPADFQIHLHCFTGGLKSAQAYLEYFHQLCIGITGLVGKYQDNRRQSVADVAQGIPLSRLLLETDAPFLKPTCAKGIQWTHPGMVLYPAQEVATLRQISLEEVLAANFSNFKQLYNVQLG
jgi:TatD DNase family protein